ncbi:MAG: GPH family glycoside/pentoside/hexuronide:cation symporter [Limisphaerales bacterium]|jgi:GPH family glycoside/pentoside/hexuronide:cation symporter
MAGSGEEVPPLGIAVRLSFGIGQIAEGLKTCVFGTYLLFYYNQVLGLSGDLAGLAIFIALVFDAVTDPIAGSVSDRWQSKGGRRHPFMYASAVPLGVCFVLLFTPIESVTGTQFSLFLWMVVLTIATRASMTLYTVPHQALGAELSTDYDERTVLVALRHFFGAVGFILAYGFGYGYFFASSEAFPNGQLNPAAYPPYAITLGILMTLSILITAFGTRSRIPYMPKAQVTEERIRARDVLGETLEAMRNKSFRWIMFGFILFISAWGVAGVLGIYVYTFFWELTVIQILFVSLMLPIGSMGGYALSKVYFAWLDKKNAMIAAGIVWMFIHAIPVGAYVMGWAPDTGTWGAAVFLAIVTIFSGMVVGQVIVGIGTAMADIADENELDSGRRQEGVFFGASSFANKCSAGVGTLLAGRVLEIIEWPTGGAVKSAADIAPETVFNLALVAGPVIGLLVIPAVLCLQGYALNRERLEEIQSELRSRALAN